MIGDWCTRMHVHTAYPTSHQAGWVLAKATMLYNYRLARCQGAITSYIKPYWCIKDDMSVMDGLIMKGRCIIIPKVLQQQAHDHLHVTHMGIEKTKLLACESVYWVNIDVDSENYI